jgi:hypothetical protein
MGPNDFIDSEQANPMNTPTTPSKHMSDISPDVQSLLQDWHKWHGHEFSMEVWQKAVFHFSATLKGLLVKRVATSQKDCFITFFVQGTMDWLAGQV